MFADGSLAHAREVAEAFGHAFEALAAFTGVRIAAINGYAMGGARSRWPATSASPSSRPSWALPEASVGLLPCAGGTQRLTELVGPGWAKRMILCGEKVSATLAYEMGLVEEVVTEGHAWEAAQQMAQLVERQSPSALRACKQLINQGRSTHGDAALPLERSLFLALFDDASQREGVAAFLEKRAPRWRYDQSKPKECGSEG